MVAVELSQVLYAILLAVAYLLIFSIVANLELGPRYTAGPRDRAPEGLSKRGQRLQRAYSNMVETLPWFIGAVLVTHLAGKVDDVTIAAGWLYLGARVLYLPAYVFHVQFVRSAVWGLATLGIVIIVFRALM